MYICACVYACVKQLVHAPIYIYIYIYIYIHQSLGTSKKWQKVNFKRLFNPFEFRIVQVKEFGLLSYLRRIWRKIDPYLSQEYYVKCKQPHPGFGLRSPYLLPTTIAIAPWVFPIYLWIYRTVLVWFICLIAYQASWVI